MIYYYKFNFCWNNVLNLLRNIISEWNEVAQSCPTLCDPVDCSLPGSSVLGILQARILEWVAIPFSRRSSQPRDGMQCLTSNLHWQAALYKTLAPPGKPQRYLYILDINICMKSNDICIETWKRRMYSCISSFLYCICTHFPQVF